MPDIIAESFPSVLFSNLSKVNSLLISNVGVLTINRFMFCTLHNVCFQFYTIYKI